MRQLIGLMFLALFAAQSVQAQSQSHQYSGIADADSLTIIDDLAFEFDVRLTLGQMMREPVVSSRFRWLINVQNSRATIPAMGIGDSRYEDVPLAGLGAQAPGKVRIYDVKIEYQLSTPVGTLYLLSDAGDPAPGDGRKWSFNVPGSPNWAQMFYRSPIQTVNGSRSFVSAQTAKQAMNNVRLVHARVLDAQISFYDLHTWYMRSTDAAEAIATERAIEPLRIALYRNFGYEVPGVSGAFFSPSTALGSVRSGIGTLPSMMSDYLDRAGPRLAKLLEVPKKLHTSENTAIYNDAVRAARSTIAQARQQAAAYSSPDKDPRSFRQGREGRFGNPEEESGLTPVTVSNLTWVGVRDHGEVDGDRVSITVRDLQTDTVLLNMREVSLGSTFQTFAPDQGFPPGAYEVRITALNTGRRGKNTGELRINGNISVGLATQEYNLSARKSGALRVRVLE